MFIRDIYADEPPHPLGIVCHPEWERVRDRRAERVCNQILRDARAARPKPVPFLQTRFGEAVAGLALMAAMLGAGWALAIYAVLPQ